MTNTPTKSCLLKSSEKFDSTTNRNRLNPNDTYSAVKSLDPEDSYLYNKRQSLLKSRLGGSPF